MDPNAPYQSEEHVTRRAKVTKLVKEQLWATGGVHPARSGDAAELFDELMRLHESKGKSMVLHNEEGELHIFHYGQAVQNGAKWTPELLLARGLIMRRDAVTGDTSLVATPWPKFFNLGEDGLSLPELAAATEGGGSIEVTSKMDGSLGLLFFDVGAQEWRVVTKGSFRSDQAKWATEWLADNVDVGVLTPGVTYLVEIVYRENRIVIPYAFDGLVLLSAFDEAGRELSRAALEAVAAASTLGSAEPEPEPQADATSMDSKYGTMNAGASGLALAALHEFETLDELLREVKEWPGADREGVVIRFCFPDGTSHRVKVKGTEYLAKHRCKDGFTAKKVWEAMKLDGDQAAVMRDVVPEELLPEFDAIVSRVGDACDAALLDISADYDRAEESLSRRVTKSEALLSKKQVAQWARTAKVSAAFTACMFAPFVPYADAGSEAVPTQPGAYRTMVGQSRKLLLGFVLKSLVAEDSRAKSTNGGASAEVGPQLSKAAKKKAKKARQKAKKQAAALLARAA